MQGAGGTGGEGEEWVAPALPRRRRHRRENRTEAFIAGTPIVARLLPPVPLSWFLKLTKAGNTTAIPLLRPCLQPQLLCGTEWMRSFLAHFLPKDRQTGSPRRCHTHPNHLSYSSFSVLVFWKKKPHTLLTILALSRQPVQPTLQLLSSKYPQSLSFGSTGI